MRTLITYRRNQFANLKDQLEIEGYDYVSALSLIGADGVVPPTRERSRAIDVSSLLALLDPSSGNGDLGAAYEALLHRMPESTLFIADEAVASRYWYGMRTIFDNVRPCNTQGGTEEQTMTSNEKPKRLIDLDDASTEEMLNRFDTELIGQDKFKRRLRKQVRMFRLFNGIGEQPILSLFLIGPSGVGKTETARILSGLVASGETLPKINFGNYSSKDSLNSLIGSPRGYMGSEEGELTMKIGSSKSGVILIDEFEKGDSAVWSFFLDLLENGKFTDSQGEEHDINGYTIVFTSNTPRAQVGETFPPELLSRFDLKANFSLLNDGEKGLFVHRYIASVAEKYRANIDKALEEPGAIADLALQEIDTSSETNIRVLKNRARCWFAGYVSERNQRTVIR